jgi:hypothetical protein
MPSASESSDRVAVSPMSSSETTKEEPVVVPRPLLRLSASLAASSIRFAGGFVYPLRWRLRLSASLAASSIRFARSLV